MSSRLPDSWLRAIGFTVRRSLAGADPARRRERLCVFASYDGRGRVDPYVFEYLTALRGAGFDLVFVTTSAQLRDDDAAALRRLCRRVVLRANAGHDFYSWKVGLQAVDDLGAYSKVAIANDSVYGPFADLGPLVARMDAEPDAVWGMCDSLDTGRHHLQSWFVYFDRAHVRSPFFRDFWRQVIVFRRKEDIIERCEIGLSTRAQAAGLAIRACFPYADLKARAQARGDAYQYRDELAARDLNPTLKMWDLLLGDLDFPFLKTELLKFNHYGARGVDRWQDLVRPSAARRLASEHAARFSG